MTNIVILFSIEKKDYLINDADIIIYLSGILSLILKPKAKNFKWI